MCCADCFASFHVGQDLHGWVLNIPNPTTFSDVGPVSVARLGCLYCFASFHVGQDLHGWVLNVPYSVAFFGVEVASNGLNVSLVLVGRIGLPFLAVLGLWAGRFGGERWFFVTFVDMASADILMGAAGWCESPGVFWR